MDGLAGNLATIDYIIIGVYMIGVLYLGSYFAKYIHSSGDFFLAGRALPFWAIGMSIVVSDIGAVDLITGAGAAYDRGIAQANFDWIGSVPAILLAAFIFLPYYWRAGVYTLPEFLGRRYNASTRWLHAMVLLAFMLATVSVMLFTSSLFLNKVLNIDNSLDTYFGNLFNTEFDFEWAIWGTAIVVGCYAVSGGLAAVVMTDVMQMVVMFVGTGALLTLGLWEVGGWEGMTEKILAQPDETEEYFRLLVEHKEGTEYPWPGMVFSLGIVMSTAYFVGNQAVMQRALGARTEWDAKAGMLTAGLFKMAIPILVFLPGMAARGIFPDLDTSDAAIPTLIDRLMPAGLKGLMFAAFFAALMSSVDSYLNSCVTIFTGDVYRPIHKRMTGNDLSGRLGLIIGRVMTAAILVAAAFYAPNFAEKKTLYDVTQTLLSLFQGPTLAILLLGIFWRGATAWGGFFGLVIGVCLTMILNILGDTVFISADGAYLFVSFWSFLASVAVVVIVSLFTKKKSDEELAGLVYGSVVVNGDGPSKENAPEVG